MIDNFERWFVWLRALNRRRLLRRRSVRDPGAIGHLQTIIGEFELPVPADAWVAPSAIGLATSITPEISIIIPAHGKSELTLRCLASLHRNPPSSPYEVIVVEEASGAPGADSPGQVPGVRFMTHPQNLGFLRSCNAAAVTAKGSHLMFLNNDTQVMPDAVQSLRKTFDRHPRAGLVGAKLVYPDGRLQEAGGIVWSDGSTCSHGRNGNPADPRYNYLRETDFISGAAIMVETALWRQLGGFDERFSPASFADTDLAMQVREAGRQVLYEPSSTVVHLEGASNATDEGSGPKMRQAINASVFADKWRTTLARDHLPDQAQNTFVARDHARHRRIVLVTNDQVITPDADAGSRAIGHMLDGLLALGHVVKFWPENPDDRPPYGQALRQRGIEVFTGSHRPDFENWMRVHGRHIDIAALHRPEQSRRVLPTVRRHSAAHVVYYGHDLHFKRLAAQAEVTGLARGAQLSAELQRIEAWLWQNVDLSIYFSQEEVSSVLAHNGQAKVRAAQAYCFGEVPLPPAATPGQRLIFVAGFEHPPNVDAALWLVHEVMPLVWEKLPGVHLSLVGSKPTADISAVRQRQVDVTGWVSDERLCDLYRKSRVAVVPLRFGAGVKHKVVEALSRGVPLVATSVGAQGLPGLQEACLMGDDAPALAKQIITLMGDDDLWMRQVGKAAEYIKANFSSASLHSQMADMLETL